MRRSSKHILDLRCEAAHRTTNPWGWAVLMALAAAAIAEIWPTLPMSLIPVAFIIAIYCMAHFSSKRRLDQLALARVGESIGQFARHFRRDDGFDPVVVRAVYKLTQEQLGRADLPPRPSDHLADTYGIVDEDLNDLGTDVANLAHRSMEAAENNPLYGRVATIGDLVRFIQFQPRLAV